MSSVFFNSTLVSRHDLGDILTVFKIKPDHRVPAFKPGQFVWLGMPDPQAARESKPEKLMRRPYSLVSAPQEAELEFYLSHVPGGELSSLLWPLKAGDRIFTSPAATGQFTLDEVPADKHLILVATGTGIAPFVSMYRHFRGQNRWKKLIVLHGARREADLGYRDEFEAAAKSDRHLHYLPIVSRETVASRDSDSTPLMQGHVQNALNGEHFQRLFNLALTPDDCQVMLCGNPAMVDEVQQNLSERGFAKHSRRHPGNLHFEKFW